MAHRVDTTTAVGAPPAPQPQGDPGFFTKGDPTANPPFPATVPGPDWFNMMQEEVAAAVEGAGLALDQTKGDFTQLRQAIQQMIAAGARVVKIPAALEATVADGDPVRWDVAAGEFVKALADGTANNRAVGLADAANAEVILFGEARDGLVAGLTPGSRYYLSDAAPGAMTDTAPADAVRLGIAKSATAFFVDVDTAAAPASAFTTGDAKITLKAVADAGWVMADDGTIGDAGSGATTRANADTEALYALLWANVADAWAPVTGGRGASAAADIAAGKPLALTRQLGRALGIAGTGSGLTARALGETLGEEAHAQTAAEMAAHEHKMFRDLGANFALPRVEAGTSPIVNGGTGGSEAYRMTSDGGAAPTLGRTSATGTGDPANVMQPTTFWNVMIKI